MRDGTRPTAGAYEFRSRVEGEQSGALALRACQGWVGTGERRSTELAQ